MNALRRFRAGVATALLVSSWPCLAHADEPAHPQPDARVTDEAARKELAEKAKVLYAEADKLFGEARWDDATKKLEETLSVLAQLYPKERFPQGSRDIAFTLRSLGAVTRSANRLGLAQQWFEKSLAAYRLLYPPDQFPNGHIEEANAITLLALAIEARGDLEAAQARFEEALQITRRLFPVESHSAITRPRSAHPFSFPSPSRDPAPRLKGMFLGRLFVSRQAPLSAGEEPPEDRGSPSRADSPQIG